MANPDATLLDDLRNAVSAGNVVTAGEDLEPYLVDWRGRYHGRTRALVRPGSTSEVAAVVRLCAAAGVPIVPQGGNTGMCGGATPDDTGREIVLSLVRMKAVRNLDVDNATLTVEAGLPLAAVQQIAASRGLYFPLSLASEGSCTIGGNLSTNAGGTAVLRFGNARELTLGVEVVLADGRVLDALRGLRKDNTGYDLKQLFIGGEGTLGIITAAVLKLFPAPRTRVTALVAVADVGAAVTLLHRLKQALSDRLVGFELMSAFALRLSRHHHPDLPDPLPGHPWYVLVQSDDSAPESALLDQVEAALATAVENGIAIDAAIAQSNEQAAKMWALRENISEAQRREGLNIKHDIALPVSAIPAFIVRAQVAIAAALPGSRLVVFGHLGDGNLHYNLSAPVAVDSRDFLSNTPMVNRIVHDLVHEAAGSISAEHGIGQLKRAELRRYKSSVEIDVMQAIKRALDPNDILNPGKVL
jgi:FAD/FMN-containing dehydrogenase